VREEDAVDDDVALRVDADDGALRAATKTRRSVLVERDEILSVIAEGQARCEVRVAAQHG
jgi:hypothetical protein